LIFSKKNILDRLTTIEELKSQEIEIEDALRSGKIVVDQPVPKIREILGPYFLVLPIGKIEIPENPSIRSEICVDFTQPKTLGEKFETFNQEKVFLHPNPRTFLRITAKRLLGIPTDLIGQVTIKREFAKYGLGIIGGTILLEPGFIGRAIADVKNFGNRPMTLTLELPIFQLTFQLLSSCVDIVP